MFIILIDLFYETSSNCILTSSCFNLAKGQHIDWYRAFRGALQNPDAGQEVRKRYKLLVEFLDNTVIHRPNSQHTKFSEVESPRHKLPKYKPLPSIKSPGIIYRSFIQILNVS